ncbi:MAG: polysaccharide lyase family 8 super-sandwich domain-containing protein [Paludibacter sp.]|nr:polysaccharide lyase family 8 super-sandwich domain-containing protein [Paludibacter sp.]
MVCSDFSEWTHHSKYNNDTYKNAIKKGLEYWHLSNTTDLNWWFNRIYCPQKLGETLIFLREFEGFIPTNSAVGIDEPEILSLLQPQAINDITAHGTGANAIDIGLHYVYRGILTQNSSLLEGTRDRLELILTENIKSDYVFHDHGPQIQISSYGWVFADGIIRLASYLAGSPAAFDVQNDSFSKVINFIRETQVSSVRGSSWDFSVMGRAISRTNALNAGMNYLQKMADFIDPAHATIYLDALNRMKGNKPANYNVREFNKHYWASDYTQHARNGYLFAVRNVSLRTVEAETGNGENLKANYFSYGANFISVDGNEYKNIMPYWDWCMIPGSTFPYTTSYPTRTTWGTNFGTTTFVGGVSDGNYGVSVMDMNKSGMQAKKSWFFFDNEVVCLGAGISDNSNRNVRTTVNQAKMENPSYYTEVGNGTEKMHSVSANTYSNTNLSYLRNGKIAYFFPQQGNLKYTMKSQSGAWKDINTSGSATTESGYVFTLWFDHGINPVSENYSYIVVPDIDTKEKVQAYDTSAIEIISNTTSVQAVLNKTLDILQIIFHQAGSITHGNRTITVNRPCALMIKNGTYVSVSDPSQSNSIINVEIEVNGVIYQKFISMPTENEMNGSSVTLDFEIPTGNITTSANQDIQIICFPNPTSQGIVNIHVNEGESLHCEVRCISGQLILNMEFIQLATIDLNKQPPGIYFVSVYHNNKTYSQKIFKY